MNRRSSGFIALLVFLVFGVAASRSASALSLRCGQRSCPVSVSSTAFSLRFGETSIKCEGVQGEGRFTTRTTASLRLVLRTCEEQSTPFSFSCLGAGNRGRQIQSATLGTHLLVEGSAQKFMIMGLRIPLICGFGPQLVVEGFIQSYIARRQCNVRAISFRVPTELIGHGREGAGNAFDVFVDGQDYGNWRFASFWRLSFRDDVSIKC